MFHVQEEVEFGHPIFVVRIYMKVAFRLCISLVDSHDLVSDQASCVAKSV